MGYIDVHREMLTYTWKQRNLFNSPLTPNQNPKANIRRQPLNPEFYIYKGFFLLFFKQECFQYSEKLWKSLRMCLYIDLYESIEYPGACGTQHSYISAPSMCSYPFPENSNSTVTATALIKHHFKTLDCSAKTVPKPKNKPVIQCSFSKTLISNVFECIQDAYSPHHRKAYLLFNMGINSFLLLWKENPSLHTQKTFSV